MPPTRVDSSLVFAIRLTGNGFVNCIITLQILTSGGLCRVASKCCRFDYRFPCCRFVMPEVDLCETRLHANRVES